MIVTSRDCCWGGLGFRVKGSEFVEMSNRAKRYSIPGRMSDSLGIGLFKLPFWSSYWHLIEPTTPVLHLKLQPAAENEHVLVRGATVSFLEQGNLLDEDALPVLAEWRLPKS